MFKKRDKAKRIARLKMKAHIASLGILENPELLGVGWRERLAWKNLQKSKQV